MPESEEWELTQVSGAAGPCHSGECFSPLESLALSRGSFGLEGWGTRLHPPFGSEISAQGFPKAPAFMPISAPGMSTAAAPLLFLAAEFNGKGGQRQTVAVVLSPFPPTSLLGSGPEGDSPTLPAPFLDPLLATGVGYVSLLPPVSISPSAEFELPLKLSGGHQPNLLFS